MKELPTLAPSPRPMLIHLSIRRLFLAGIREHGVGKWQKLAREFVTTRNASQIASHYQKYSIRQQKLRRNECKRPSIHDINDDDTPSPVGEQSAAAAGGDGC